MLLPHVEEPADVGAVLTAPTDRGSLRTRLRDRRVWLVIVAATVSLALQVVWYAWLSTSGGDAAAQDAWAEFARKFPGSAYDLAWYGGMHPSSYSVVSPYVMAALGVRTTMLLSSVACGVLVALLVSRVTSHGWRRYAPTLAGVLAFLGNAASGRVTFALGTALGLGALCLLLAVRDRPRRGWVLGARAGVALLALLSTAASPVSGLFLGIVAAAMWLRSRRADAYLIGLPPVVVVGASAVLFPFSGVQPMPWYSVILPMATGIAVAALAPKPWAEIRLASAVYALGVLLVWLVHSPIGTNISRLALVFGGVVLVAALVDADRATSAVARRWGERVAVGVLAATVLGSLIWQGGVTGRDLARSRTPKELDSAITPVVDQLKARNSQQSRVEVVPLRSHAEAAAFAPYVALARGWNRQADVARNPIFYDDGALTPASYRAWLRTWAVGFVVISSSAPDPAATEEAALVRSGLPYLQEVWSDATWRIYQVKGATPLVSRPGEVIGYDSARLDLWVPRAGRYVVRIAYSPWLTLVDAEGHELPSADSSAGSSADSSAGEGADPGPRGGADTGSTACLSQQEPPPAASADGGKPTGWVVLHAPEAGVYRLAAPYRVGGRATCPSP